jgi:hypothetical protein
MESNFQCFMTVRRFHELSGKTGSPNLHKLTRIISKACVVAILTTGSISSTSGASSNQCQAAPPENLADALNSRPGDLYEPLFYREEIYHPAITLPVINRGWFEHTRDGHLKRHQTEPEIETTRIGEAFIFLRRGQDGESNIFPIPKQISPLLDALRSIIGQTDTDRLLTQAPQLDINASGWLVTLSPGREIGTNTHLVLGGCGDQLQSVELQLQNQERRLIVFERTP